MYIRGKITENERIGVDGYIKKEIVRQIAEGHLTSCNACIVQEYLDHLKATHGIKPKTMQSNYNSIRSSFGIVDKDYKDYDIHDIKKIISEIRSSGREQSTQRTYITVLKQFFKYLVKEEIFHDIKIEKISEIKLPKDVSCITEEKLLTRDEIDKLMKSCKNSRDRALIAILDDGGLRIDELLSLQWRNVTIEPNYIKITVIAKKEKTETIRHVPIIRNQHYLINWRADSQYTGKDDYVFYPRNGKRISYNGWQNILSRLVRRAGLQNEKRIYAHLFRHGAVTNDRKNPLLTTSTGVLEIIRREILHRTSPIGLPHK